eukprot:COSAG02_NODE_14070_length_1314_cov_1.003292_2_plen_72_part_00
MYYRTGSYTIDLHRRPRAPLRLPAPTGEHSVTTRTLRKLARRKSTRQATTSPSSSQLTLAQLIPPNSAQKP